MQPKNSLAIFWLLPENYEEIKVNSKYLFLFFISDACVIENCIIYVQDSEWNACPQKQ